MTVLRIGAPGGEAVISADEHLDAAEITQLFDLIASFGWPVEERRDADRFGNGWIGSPLRSANAGDPA